MGSLGDPAIPETGGVGRRPKDMLDTHDLIPILWHTPAAKMTPFWDPNFPLPCGQLAAPFLHAHREPGPNPKLYTQI